ncbi:polyprenyl synthetase family protein, partial [bacterium]|nr:polyprenyl synthetase family protein [bacterium]
MSSTVGDNPIKAIHSLIEPEMAAVDAQIRDSMIGRYSEPIREVHRYLLEQPGKRLRPMLALLSAKAINPDMAMNNSIKLASAIELVHMASLIHDDVIDSAETRHNQICIHQKFGIEVAIPVGVLLYSLSLKLMASIGDIEIVRRVSRAVDQLCAGELDQVMNRDQFGLSLVDYLLILKKKTGALFSMAAWGGARLAGANSVVSRQMYNYGTSVGLLFQITDDLLDYSGNSRELKKGANQDFILGEITLPLILLRDKLTSEQKSALYRALG